MAQKTLTQRACSSQSNEQIKDNMPKKECGTKSCAVGSGSSSSLHKTAGKLEKSGPEVLSVGKKTDDKCSNEPEKMRILPNLALSLRSTKKSTGSSYYHNNLKENPNILQETDIEDMKLKKKLALAVDTMSTLKPSGNMIGPLLSLKRKLRNFGSQRDGTNIEPPKILASKKMDNH